jgi:hypothetical protein
MKGLYKKNLITGRGGIKCYCCNVIPRGKNNSNKTNKTFLNKLNRKNNKLEIFKLFTL